MVEAKFLDESSVKANHSNQFSRPKMSWGCVKFKIVFVLSDEDFKPFS